MRIFYRHSTMVKLCPFQSWSTPMTHPLLSAPCWLNCLIVALLVAKVSNWQAMHSIVKTIALHQDTANTPTPYINQLIHLMAILDGRPQNLPKNCLIVIFLVFWELGVSHFHPSSFYQLPHPFNNTTILQSTKFCFQWFLSSLFLLSILELCLIVASQIDKCWEVMTGIWNSSIQLVTSFADKTQSSTTTISNIFRLLDIIFPLISCWFIW